MSRGRGASNDGQWTMQIDDEQSTYHERWEIKDGIWTTDDERHMKEHGSWMIGDG